MPFKIKKSFRASKISGIPVRTPEQENVGKIEDVVVDIEDGKVAYAVLHFTAYFGLQDKLFAIPWRALNLIHDEDARYFQLDTSREQLRSAPGFDRNDWPDVASNEWREQVNDHFE